jgi:hypothetical protein
MLARIWALTTLLVVQVKLDRTAATCLGRDHGLDACGVQHPAVARLMLGLHGRLHTARQQQHLAGVGGDAGRRPRPALAGTLFCSAAGSRPRTSLAQLHGRAKQGRGRPSLSAQRKARSDAGARHLGIDQLAAYVEQMAVLPRPLGQVVSQLRQVRQRSRCNWVLRVGVTPSSTCLIR